jgi:hypothetical protein
MSSSWIAPAKERACPTSSDCASSTRHGSLASARLADAAAAALALVDLRGRSADTIRARRAAVHAAGPNVSSRRLSECLGIGVRAVQSLRTQRSEPAMIRAVERQALLRSAMRPASEAHAGTGIPGDTREYHRG